MEFVVNLVKENGKFLDVPRVIQTLQSPVMPRVGEEISILVDMNMNVNAWMPYRVLEVQYYFDASHNLDSINVHVELEEA
jgi:hypothetical protein